jgi:surface antigen
LTVLVAAGLTTGGCAMSGLSLFSSEKDDARAYATETTGSVSSSEKSKHAAVLPPETDLLFAKIAAIGVLGHTEATSAPWENPRSGARGTVTPIAATYTQDGSTCRDFLASYLNGKSEAWMQGQGCRSGSGKWEVKSLRPWQRS